MTTITVLRRLRCDQLEAVIARYRDPTGRARYGVFFHRLPGSALAPEHPLLADDELAAVAGLARLAARVIATLVAADPPTTSH
jgi:hypothetical protein